VENKNLFLIVVSYATIYLVWGSTYFFIKLSVQSIPPFYVVGIRFTVGGFLLLLLSFVTGRLKSLPKKNEILSAILLATLLLLMGNGFITVAEQRIASYVIALLISSTPIVVAFFNRIIFGMKIGFIKFAGILVGTAGVGFLLYDGSSILTSINYYSGIALLGVLSWGLATSLGHRMPVYRDSFVNSGLQMLFAGIVSMIFSSINYVSIGDIIPEVTLQSVIGVAYLSIIGSLAFNAYTYLIRNQPSIRVVSYAFVNPVIAVFIGVFLGQENIVPYFFIGLPLIFLGLLLMLYGEILIKKITRTNL